MKALELRIGNLLTDEHDNIMRVNSMIEPSTIYTEYLGKPKLSVTTQKLKYIPLTEEWLLKFGFNKISYGTFRLKSDRIIIEVRIEDEVFGIYFEYIDTTDYISWDFKYVHQLQNLYFALTGKELTI